MNRKILLRIFMQPFTMVLIILVTQALFLCVTADIVFAQQLFAPFETSSPSASAGTTPTTNVPYAPRSVDIKRNMLLQQQASINQSITVATACIQNNSLPSVLRDTEGNIRSVPSTDVANCARTLSSLLNLLAANQKALNDLSQDSQLELSRTVTQANKNKLTNRLQIITNGLPPGVNQFFNH